MSTALVPPGKTYFDVMKRTFADVPVDRDNDNAISTTEFLEAAESLTTLFDALGSVAFKPVKADMLGNVNKLRDRQKAEPLESSSVQSLVANELKAKKSNATVALLWLVRGLDFTAQSLRQNLTVPGEELATSFRFAYGNTLKPHHGMLVKPIFSAAMSATPYRKDFYPKLGDDKTRVEEGLNAWLLALEEQVKILKAFQERPDIKIKG